MIFFPATIVPFAHLDDLISSGILIAFTITDVAVILVRKTSPADNPNLLQKMLTAFLALSILSGLLLRNCLSLERTDSALKLITLLSCGSTAYVGNTIRTHCPSKKSLTQTQLDSDEPDVFLFLTPFVPTLPLLGCFVSI